MTTLICIWIIRHQIKNTTYVINYKLVNHFIATNSVYRSIVMNDGNFSIVIEKIVNGHRQGYFLRKRTKLLIGSVNDMR